MQRASSERERDDIRMSYQRKHAQLDSETEERLKAAKADHRAQTTNWKRQVGFILIYYHPYVFSTP
jgi:hypothetical protein